MGLSLVSNPPYNLRWEPPALAGLMDNYAGYEIPPKSNANFAFILSGLSLAEDRAVFLLPNSVLQSSVEPERIIKEQLISENLLLAVISLPGNMFESTGIPTCLLVFDRNKKTRKIALMDLSDLCVDEVRDQRGQCGGASHTGRTYHKTVKVIPPEVMDQCLDFLDSGTDKPGVCAWVLPEQVAEQDWNLTPRRYFSVDITTEHRPFADIAADYNRIIRQKNAIKIRMNRTAAVRLGYDCMDVERPELSESFAIVGQKPEKESYITFSANDGIQITISTKEGIHPLIVDFLKGWRQMIMYLNTEENRLLAEFRDALLPELMSGKIQVSAGGDGDG